MTADVSTWEHVLSHGSMFPMSSRRREQPLVAFRMDQVTAERFTDKCDLEAMSKQMVLETLARAFVAGDLPDIRELRRMQAQRAAPRGDTSTSGD